MLEEKMTVPVGVCGLDDKRTIPIEGVLIKPDNPHHDIEILFIGGLLGWRGHYVDYFSRYIGKRWPIYTTELRGKGLARGQTLVNDVIQIDAHVRGILKTDNILYFGHSMGVPIAVEASRQHGRQVLGYLGMATYPYMGKLNIGPFAYPILDAKISAPSHFVIADNDWILFNILEINKEEINNYFGKFGTTSIIPGNHWFNQRWHKLKLRPFNEGNPQPLVQEAYSFVEQVCRHFSIS